jgi:TRAP transporter TAXI family solute receptor
VLRYGRRIAVLVALVAVGVCGCSQGTTAARKRLSIATGGTGGVFYPYGGAIARVISENLEGVEATAEVTGASVDNLKFIKQGTSDLALTMADTAQDAVAARDAFADFGAVPVRTLAVLYPSFVHLVTRDGSGIASVADLRGRIVSIGSPGSGTAVLAQRILEAAGLTPGRDLRTQSLGVAQSVDALKDAKVDAFFWNGGLPTAAIVDLVNTPGITAHFIATDNVLPQLQQKYGPSLYYREIIPAATYGAEADTPVVGVANLLVVSESMDEQLAYDITRLLFEKQADLIAVHQQAKELSLQNAVAGSPIPFHPGAVRFYRERQVWKE